MSNTRRTVSIAVAGIAAIGLVGLALLYSNHVRQRSETTAHGPTLASGGAAASNPSVASNPSRAPDDAAAELQRDATLTPRARDDGWDVRAYGHDVVAHIQTNGRVTVGGFAYGDSFDVRTRGVGRASVLRGVETPQLKDHPSERTSEGQSPSDSNSESASTTRIDLVRTALVEWWRGTDGGLEQGFDIAAKLPGNEPLKIAVDVTGASVETAADGSALLLATANTRFRYAGLSAHDAQGLDLPAQFVATRDGFSIQVDDRNASYPIVIDPFVTTVAWLGEVDSATARYGSSVASAGDVNGDGFSDVIIGAPEFDNGQTNEGRALVYLGSATGLATTAVWSIESNVANALFGAVVSSAGDVNGDGFGDVAVGAPGFINTLAGEGRVTVYLGGAAGLATTPAWTTHGGQAGANFGAAIAFGDITSDGFSELVVGAPLFDNGQTDEGRVSLFVGSAAGLSTTANTVEANQASAQFGSAVALGDFFGTGTSSLVVGAPLFDNGETDEGRVFRFVVNAAGAITSAASWTVEANQANARFGASVAVIGASGTPGSARLLVGAPLFDNGETDEGRAFVYAAAGAELSTSALRTDESNQASAEFGRSVAFVGDANGDGLGDWAVGAPLYDNGQLNEGRVYVFEGAAADAIATPSTFESDQGDASQGVGLGGAGDVNGDGLSDLVIGAPLFDNGQSDEGQARVHLGFVSVGMNERNHVTSVGTANPADFGEVVRGLGDVNGDGFTDVGVIDGVSSGSGSIYIYFGTAAGPTTTTSQVLAAPRGELAPLGDVNRDGYDDITAGRRLYYGSASGVQTSHAYDFGATTVEGAGDVNGDGYADVIVGDLSFGIGGRGLVLHGAPSGMTVAASLPAVAANENCGETVGSVGDVNGDGFDDVAVLCPFHTNGHNEEGRVRVYHGGPTGVATTPAFEAESNCADGLMGAENPLGNGPHIAYGDFDGNGRSDFAVGTSCSGSGVILFRSGPAGVLDGFTALPLNISTFTLDSGDFNGDGLADLLADRAVRYGTTSGLSAPQALIGIGGFIYNGFNASAGDTNGDGFDDIITRILGTLAGHSPGEGAGFYMGGPSSTDPTGVRSARLGLTQPGTSTRLSARSASTSSRNVGYVWNTPYSAFGRTRSRVQLAAAQSNAIPRFSTDGALLSAFAPSDSASFSGTFDPVTAPLAGTAYRLRLRLRYAPSHQVAVPWSRWVAMGSTRSHAFRTALCATGRANSASGSCDVCQANYYGSNCDFCQAATTCNAHGTCAASGAGACVCSAEWTGATCNTCAAGRAGPNCEYSDAGTCSGHGVAQTNGSCVCSAGFGGTRCDACAANHFGYPTCTFCAGATTCNAHGSCNAAGGCACATGFAGATCNTCAAGFFNYPTCAACDPAITCGGNGTCTGGGACSCSAGFAGANCQYSDANTCSGRGTAQANGTCICNANFAGANCGGCVSGRAGSSCQYTDAVTCSGHGTAQNDGSCVCASGWTGAACDFSASSTCNNHGAAQPNGSCICSSGYTGATCNACATNYYAYPTCAFCDATSTCNGRGSCTATGACSCAAGAAGPQCQYADATTCNGHGTAQSNGTCTCQSGFTGASCNACAPGFAGYPGCMTCDRGTTCNNHGSCNAQGCVCDASYTGSRCDQCAPGFAGYPQCAACDAQVTCRGRGACASSGCVCNAGFAGPNCQYSNAVSCNGHGRVDASGTCSCDAGYSGASCETCAADYVGYPTCRACSAATTCNGNGTCTATGACACSDGFAGSRCEFSRAATCNGRGTPSVIGACTCDAGFAGARCQYGRDQCNGNGNPQDSGACLCFAGFAGARCDVSALTACNGHGLVRSDGSCTCQPGFTGTRCDACAANYLGYPSCSYCDARQCAAGGRCGTDGRCVCDGGRAGVYCEFSDAQNCNSRGRVATDGSCTCNATFGGPTCAASDAVTCNAHGSVQPDASCVCAAGWLGARCQYSNATTCNAHGVVDANGVCTCAQGFTGASCDTCTADHYGPSCTYCVAAATCNTHGSCAAAGGCTCESGWFGPGCEFSRAATCSSHGTPNARGQCACDVGWAGAACERCAPDWYPARATSSTAACSVNCNESICGGHGTCTSQGRCICEVGYQAPNCAACADGTSCHTFDASMPSRQCAAGTAPLSVSTSTRSDPPEDTSIRRCMPCRRGTWAAAGSTSCTAVNCVDGNPCTVDSVDATTGQCVFTAMAGCSNCGNGMCEPQFGETCSTCARDCGLCAVCGDGRCASDDQHEETCWNCAEDCQTCRPPTRPADAGVSDGGRVDAATRDAGPMVGMCSGRPRLSRLVTPELGFKSLEFQTPTISGYRGELRIEGAIQYGYEYNVDDQRCEWSSSAGLEFASCIVQERSGGEVSNCTSLAFDSQSTCSALPICGSGGFVCERPQDPAALSCNSRLRASVSRSLGFKIRKDFGPFFASAELSIGAAISVTGTQRTGIYSSCSNGELQSSAGAGLTGTASASASVGITFAGREYGLSGSVAACVGVSATYSASCGGSISREAGALLTATSPSLNLIVTSIGPWTRRWRIGDTSVCE